MYAPGPGEIILILFTLSLLSGLPFMLGYFWGKSRGYRQGVLEGRGVSQHVHVGAPEPRRVP